jgi:hypothetical protein
MRRSLFIAAFVAGVVGGCYLRPTSSPGFRYSCEADEDCLALDCSGTPITREAASKLVEGCDSVEVKADPSLGVAFRQTCMAGLCEYPCDLLTFADDCPTSEGFSFCFNGACANACGTTDYKLYKFSSNDDFCTAPQTCIPLDASGIDPVLFDSLGSGGGGGGQGGQGASAEDFPSGAGFCGLRCDDRDAPPCPPGQYCTGALCLPGCDDPEASPCEEGSTCVAFGGFSSCLVTCDPSASDDCGEGEVCVPGFNVCQPTCLGDDAVDCPDSFECNPDLKICVPIGDGTTGDGTTGDSTT